MTDNVFALDANVFIEAHRRYYGLDFCPGFWECMRHFGDRGRLLTIDRVRAELLRGGDALSQWIRASPEGLFVSSGQPAVVEAFIEMMDWVEGNGQFWRAAKAEFATSADGWLAAYARVHGAVLVTHEQYSPNVKRRVPLGNVCRQFGVPVQDTFSMLRGLDVRFRWASS